MATRSAFKLTYAIFEAVYFTETASGGTCASHDHGHEFVIKLVLLNNCFQFKNLIPHSCHILIVLCLLI